LAEETGPKAPPTTPETLLYTTAPHTPLSKRIPPLLARVGLRLRRRRCGARAARVTGPRLQLLRLLLRLGRRQLRRQRQHRIRVMDAMGFRRGLRPRSLLAGSARV